MRILDNNRFKFIYVSLISTLILVYLSKINLILNINTSFVQVSSLALLVIFMVFIITLILLSIFVLLFMLLKIKYSVIWVQANYGAKVPSFVHAKSFKFPSLTLESYYYKRLNVMRC